MEPIISRFLGYMTDEKGASPHTTWAYRNDLSQFLDFLHGQRSSTFGWESVTLSEVSGFIGQLQNRGSSEATMARKVAAIKSFFAFLQAKGIIRLNPVEKFKSPHVGKSLPRSLSLREINELLGQPVHRRTPEDLRNRAMVEILYATGMRVSELISLDQDDIWEDGSLALICCRGGRKERSIPIHQRVFRILQDYVDRARPRLTHNRNEKALFLNRYGERLTRQGVWISLKGYAEVAGIKTPVTPQTLRHSFAAHMLRDGVPIQSVQRLLGHANLSSTKIYRLHIDEVGRV